MNRRLSQLSIFSERYYVRFAVSNIPSKLCVGSLTENYASHTRTPSDLKIRIDFDRRYFVGVNSEGNYFR